MDPMVWLYFAGFALLPAGMLHRRWGGALAVVGGLVMLTALVTAAV
jgi:hypothetical protein